MPSNIITDIAVTDQRSFTLNRYTPGTGGVYGTSATGGYDSTVTPAAGGDGGAGGTNTAAVVDIGGINLTGSNGSDNLSLTANASSASSGYGGAGGYGASSYQITYGDQTRTITYSDGSAGGAGGNAANSVGVSAALNGNTLTAYGSTAETYYYYYTDYLSLSANASYQSAAGGGGSGGSGGSAGSNDTTIYTSANNPSYVYTYSNLGGRGGDGGNGGNGGNGISSTAQIAGNTLQGTERTSITLTATGAGGSGGGGGYGGAAGSGASAGIAGNAGAGGNGGASVVSVDHNTILGGNLGGSVYISATARGGYAGTGGTGGQSGAALTSSYSYDYDTGAQTSSSTYIFGATGNGGQGGNGGDATAVIDANTITGGDGNDNVSLVVDAQAAVAGFGGAAGTQGYAYGQTNVAGPNGIAGANGADGHASAAITNNTVTLGASEDALSLQVTDRPGLALTITGNTFDGGAGNDTLYLNLGTHSINLDLSAGTLVVDGAGTNVVAGFETFFLGTGVDTVTGSTADETFYTGYYYNYYGARGAETFVEAAHFGHDSINGFRAGSGTDHDIIRFYDTTFANFAAVQAAMTETDYSATITDSFGDTLTLTKSNYGVALTADDFQFIITNHAPTAVTLSAASIAENSVAGTVIGTLGAVDPDAGDTATFAITSDPSGFFDIVGGQLVVRDGAAIDFEALADPHLTIAITATDALGATFTQNLVVTVTNVSGTIVGDGGNNTLIGTSEEDTLSGLGGNDILRGGLGNDLLEGGLGSDWADYSDATRNGLVVTLGASGQGNGAHSATEVDVLRSIENVIGSAYNDRFNGDAGDNIFRPGAGNDVVYGGGGNDTVDYSDAVGGVYVSLSNNPQAPTNSNGFAYEATAGVSYANPATVGTAHTTDYIGAISNVIGSAFDDRLYGTAGANILSGGAGNDIIYGLGGGDTFVGGAGDDILVGGSGQNSFVFGDGWGRDSILGWVAGTNNILDFTALSGAGVHGRGDLMITTVGSATRITHGTDTVLVSGVTASGLTDANFHFA